MSHRWIKFWPGDWKGDAALRMCGLAARGLWIECMAIMHDAEPYGHLVVNGRAPTPRQIASIVGTTAKEAEALLTELEEAGVFSRTTEGTIFSRRMVRDHAKSLQGKTHANARWGNGSDGGGATGDANAEPNRGPNGSPNGDPNTLEAEAEAEAEKKDPPTPRKRGRAVSKPGLPTAEIDDAFETLWVSYPRSDGRKPAREAFERALAKTAWDPEPIITGLLLNLGRFDTRDGGRFVPHCATWLNQERWRDGQDRRAPDPSPELPLH